MKNLLVLLILSIGSIAFAQQLTFENPLFEQAILQKYPQTDSDKNGKIDKKEAEAIKELNLMSLNITNANDVKYFKNLQSLVLTSNNIEKFKLSSFRYLEGLYIAHNKLTEFEITDMPALNTLACGRNNLQKVVVKNCPNIESLNMMDNQIQEINLALFKKLKYLGVENNKLKILDLSSNPELIQISINNNQIDTIDITKNQKLKMHILYIDDNVKIIGTEEQMEKYKPGPRITSAN
jgi:hypothetical protein